MRKIGGHDEVEESEGDVSLRLSKNANRSVTTHTTYTSQLRQYRGGEICVYDEVEAAGDGFADLVLYVNAEEIVVPHE